MKHNVACWHFCFEVPPCSGRDRYLFPSLVLFLWGFDYVKRIGNAPHPSAFQQDSLLDAQSREHAFEIPQSSLDVRCQNVMPTHVEWVLWPSNLTDTSWGWHHPGSARFSTARAASRGRDGWDLTQSLEVYHCWWNLHESPKLMVKPPWKSLTIGDGLSTGEKYWKTRLPTICNLGRHVVLCCHLCSRWSKPFWSW